mmetsp:Transcript_4578/g.11073  ORF Transcript_4578/g.11073 Transcript_4578/m.11073 type:complete len:441 (+) Transcript_4578:42-1364(+)
MGCSGSAPQQEKEAPAASGAPQEDNAVPSERPASPEAKPTEAPCQSADVQPDKMAAASRKSEAERLRLPEGPDAMSPEEWLDFQKVEIFASCEVEVGSQNGSGYGNLLFRTEDGRIFRFTVDNLPPALEGPSECPFEMDHPMAVMRASSVKEMQEVKSHTDAQRAGILLNLEFDTEAVYTTTDLGLGGCLDRRKHVVLPKVLPTKVHYSDESGLEDRRKVLNPLRRIVYVAHRWQAPWMSDPAQLTTLQVVQNTLSEQDYAWMDFWSVPPGSGAAISSMQAYVFRATELMVAAVSSDDLRRFMERTWCQVELFAALCPVVADRTFAIVGTDRGDSMRSVTYKHACDVQVQVLGEAPRDLDFECLKNPLNCGITNKEDLELLVPALLKVRDALREARPAVDSDATKFDKSHEKVSGMSDEIVSQMLMALGNCRLPKQPDRR